MYDCMFTVYSIATQADRRPLISLSRYKYLYSKDEFTVHGIASLLGTINIITRYNKLYSFKNKFIVHQPCHLLGDYVNLIIKITAIGCSCILLWMSVTIDLNYQIHAANCSYAFKDK